MNKNQLEIIKKLAKEYGADIKFNSKNAGFFTQNRNKKTKVDLDELLSYFLDDKPYNKFVVHEKYLLCA